MPQAERKRGFGGDRLVEPRGYAGEAAARLDRAVLDRNTMSDRAIQEMVLREFFEHRPTYFGNLREGLETAAKKPWTAGCHSLKGGGRTFGLLALGEAAAAAEHQAPSEEWYATLDMLFDEAQEAAEAYLAEA